MSVPSYAVDFRGHPACPCLAAWLPAYERELQDRGLLKGLLKIYQLIGSAAASATTHSKGGAFDLIDLPGDEEISVARQMGADATWTRPAGWDGPGSIAHDHGVLTGCPHNGPAAYQIDAVRAGFNGLGRGGRGGADTGPRPLSGRTWTQGIAWAHALQAKRIEDAMAKWTDPFAVVGINLVGAMPRDRRKLGTEMLEVAAQKVRANGGGLLKAVEADDADLRVLNPNLWWVRHREAPNRDGVLLAGTRDRTTATKGTWHDGAPASKVNDPRPILTAGVRVDGAPELLAGVFHLPKLPGGARAARTMLDRAHALQLDLFYTDANRDLARLRKEFPNVTIQGREVVAIGSRPGRVQAGDLRPFDVVRGTEDDDHPGLRQTTRARSNR